ncbi:unnamed protein product [Phyllotreta striolata]|uniref:Major facilitator superfamily (MFS) profile domain-containing protein n=1 Tax=Phyllotreta striolata TaxID=444603 RepID=A0A9N9TKA5_PHYSR|nr:unnamed protein product [Phyllotreta striolata]
MTFGYSAILLPQLQSAENPENTLSIDKEEASWIASMAALPMAIGSAFGALSIGKLGRKTAHSLSCIPTLIGWLLIGHSTGIQMILIGRFVTGFFAGYLASATGVYIGEIADPKHRGFFLGGISISVSSGLFLCHLMGTFLTWRTTALLCAVLPLVSQLIIVFVPESPWWLVDRDRPDEAERAFYWCRGVTDESKKEFEALLERRRGLDHTESLRDALVPEFLKPLGIITVYIVANQWAGINAITFYSITVMRETIGDGLNEYAAMLLVDFLRFFVSIAACLQLRRFGRRPIALVSGVGTAVSLFTLSAYLYAVKSYPETKCRYIPIACLVLYMVFVTGGFVPLPWAMMGELFPSKRRSLGSGVASFAAFSAFFSVVKTTPGMFERLGADGTFLVFGAVALFGTGFVYACLPETKDRTLHDIEDGFKKRVGGKS